MCGGIGVAQIKTKKKIGNDEVLDRAGRAEVAANFFRITQAEEKVVRECIVGEERAIRAYAELGCVVRQAMHQLGSTMPEDLPPEPSIKKKD